MLNLTHALLSLNLLDSHFLEEPKSFGLDIQQIFSCQLPV